METFWLDSLSAIVVDGQELRLTFAPAPDGWIAFTAAFPERAYRRAAADELTRLGAVRESELSAEIERLKKTE